jgi:hypothetical protein
VWSRVVTADPEGFLLPIFSRVSLPVIRFLHIGITPLKYNSNIMKRSEIKFMQWYIAGSLFSSLLKGNAGQVLLT